MTTYRLNRVWASLRHEGRAFVLVVSSVVLTCPSLALAACLPSPTGLLGWWPGDGNAKSVVGTNHGILAGTATANVAGLVGQCFSFDGTNSYVQIPDSPQLRPTNLTIEAWVRFNSLDSPGSANPGLQYIVFRQNSRSTDFEGFSLEKARPGGVDRFLFETTSAAGAITALESSTTVSTGIWYHVAGVRGPEFTALYVNGQLEDQAEVLFNQDYGNHPIYFGTSGQPSWDRKLKGLLDEVALYDRALSSDEVAAIYFAGAAGKCQPVVISEQPRSQTVVAGADVIFSVTASGAPPLQYQWQRRATILPGATGSVLSLPGVKPSAAGDYRVVISNPAGAITSAVAVLTVITPPLVTTQPQSSTAVAGSSASFTAAVSGSLPMSFQWRANGSNLVAHPRFTGITSNTLVISNVQPADEGYYSLWISNAAGVTPTALATLTVLVPPTITTNPVGVGVLTGANVQLQVAASGTSPLGYRWRRNQSPLSDGQNVAGAASPILTLSNVQTGDSASYDVVITNVVGAIASAPAAVSVTLTPVAPSIILQPSSQIVGTGGAASFSITAAGTVPFGYQWRRNGAPLVNNARVSGATSSTCTLADLVAEDAGDYQVTVTNSAGAVTSSVATLIVTLPMTLGAGAAVLVNSASAKYPDFPHYLQPYLENFGVPYTVLDLAGGGLGTNLSAYALLIVGHKQLDTNHTFLSAAAQDQIATAVSNGVGLVNFDSDLALATNLPRYQFVQDIFGFSYGAASPGTNVLFPPTEPLGQLHYVTARHGTNESLILSNSLSLVSLGLASNTTAVALSSGRPLVAVRKYGQGRALQWASYDWMSTTVLGPVNGLDDVLWRGLVWAARKPFVMRGMPHFAVMRIDDCAGPFNYVHIANEVGFKPFLALFISDIASQYIADLRSLVTNGNATASIHSFSGSTFFYFNHQQATSYSDAVMSNNISLGTQWHLTNGIPFGKNVIAHYSEIGPNAFAGLKSWGVEFFSIEVVPGTVEYGTPPAPWLVGGPYRLYETPRPGAITLPLYYADFLTIPGHPELNGQFFNRYTEVRNTAAPGANECGEWCPNNDVAGSTYRGTTQLKRAFDSQIMSSLFSHEWYIQNTPSVGNNNPITAANWRAILQGITNNLAPYKPIFVSSDFADQYARATRTSRLLSADVDVMSGLLTVKFSGKTDLQLQIQVFHGDDGQITNTAVAIPAFNNGTTTTVSAFLPPVIVKPPISRSRLASESVVFQAAVGGTGPLAFRWLHGEVALVDAGGISGANTPTLTLAGVFGADAGSYRLVATNAFGSVTSPPAILTVADPVLVSPPFSLRVHAGTTASFSATAVGTTPVFQWLKMGVPLAGATNSSLILPAVGASDEARYRVIVTNSYGALTSPPAQLTLYSPLRIRSFRRTNGLATISWSAIPGEDYQVQMQDHLGGSGWTNVPPIVRANSELAVATNIPAFSTRGFYRVHQVP